MVLSMFAILSAEVDSVIFSFSLSFTSPLYWLVFDGSSFESVFFSWSLLQIPKPYLLFLRDSIDSFCSLHLLCNRSCFDFRIEAVSSCMLFVDSFKVNEESMFVFISVVGVDKCLEVRNLSLRIALNGTVLYSSVDLLVGIFSVLRLLISAILVATLFSFSSSLALITLFCFSFSLSFLSL